MALTLSVPELVMVDIQDVLTFESVGEILWSDHQMEPLQQYVRKVIFIFKSFTK